MTAHYINLHFTYLLTYWLRTEEMFQYKLCVLAFKCQHGLAPAYLASDQLQQVAQVESRWRLRS